MSVWGDKPFTVDRIARLVLTLGVIVLALAALSYLSAVLLPFAIALVLAYLLAPLVRWVERWVKRRALAVLVSLTAVFGCLFLFFWAVIPVVAAELRALGLLLEGLLADATLDQRAAQYLPGWLWERIRLLLEQNNLSQLLQTHSPLEVAEQLAYYLLPGSDDVLTGLGDLLFILTSFLVVLLYLLFLLLDFERLQASYPRLIPPNYRTRILAMIGDFELAMNRYFRAQFVIVLFEILLFGIGFWAIGLPLGLLFGVLLGLLGFVPYLHVAGLAPGFLLITLHALRGGDFTEMTGLVLLVFGVVIALQELFLVPWFQGKATGLNPATILLSLSIWGALLGALGLIIALPSTYLVLAYYRRFIARQEEREEDEDDLEDEEEQLSYS